MTHCRLCGRRYYADPFGDPCDRRCPTCREQRRYWTPDQLGSRAQVYIVNRESALYGCTGIGTRTDKPEDGWKVVLTDGDGRSLYFGGGPVVVDWELPGRDGMAGISNPSRVGSIFEREKVSQDG